MIRIHCCLLCRLTICVLLTWITFARANGAMLECHDVAAHFIVPNQATKLMWKYQAGSSPATHLKYIVRDYTGHTIATGSVAIGSDNRVEVSLQLATGYYDVEFPATGQRFGIVAIPPHVGRADAFFCIDGALSWLVPNNSVREALVRVLQRNGIAMARERLNWTDIEPQAGQWHWEGTAGAQGYDTLRRQLAAHRVPVLEVFHNAPQWAGRIEKYPADLVATSLSWTAVEKHWNSAWGALEVWNEPDIFFGGNLPADQYLAIVKTLAWSHAQAGSRAKLVGGVVAHFEPSFQRCSAQNGMLDLVDVASFHTYGRAESVAALVDRFRKWTAENSRPAKPLWITECGRPWKRGTPRPEMAQDQVSALDITMKGIESLACGVERYFAFVYPYYEERDNNFGMMGRAGTPLRSMAAYVHCARRLGNTTYLGDWPTTDSQIVRARVFGNETETVVVLYTGKVAAEARVSVGFPVVRVEGIDGRVLPFDTTERELPIPDGLAYVTVDRREMENKLLRNTTARQLWDMAQGQRKPPMPASPIVVRFEYDKHLLDAKTDGYHLRNVPKGLISITCRVFNLGKEALDIALPLTCAEQPGAIRGKRDMQIHVAANSHQDVAWQVDLATMFTSSKRATFTIRPSARSVSQTTPTVFTIFAE